MLIASILLSNWFMLFLAFLFFFQKKKRKKEKNMGCVYSKAMARSFSVREELLITSGGTTDHLVSLVCSANTTATKPRTSSLSSPPTDHSEYLANVREDDDTSPAGSRSFHTVEEFDGLPEGSYHKFSTRSARHFEDFPSPPSPVDVPISLSEQTNDSDGMCESGWKRKAAAKGLAPLDVPAIDFPDSRRSGQRALVEGGQIYSPGTYITPKFGSYNGGGPDSKIIQEKDGGENSVFSQELVAAFEDCMQRLHDEEESILWEMDGHSFDDETDDRDETGNQHS
ncbi:hypothetical protein OROMI_022634 [Orobanche minor]